MRTPTGSAIATGTREQQAAVEEAQDLAAELGRTIAGEVRFDAGARALYATDLSMYRQVPIGVVIPRSPDDVLATVEACRLRRVPILGRGCGTSLAGQCCNVAVVIDFSKYLNRIRELNPHSRTAWVEPGVICDQLRDAAEQYQLTFAPDPATHAYCTLGGMIGNNSCGTHSVMGGRTADNTEELEILTYDGLRMHVGPTSDTELDRIIQQGGRRSEIYRRLRDLRDRYADEIRQRYPRIPRRVSGYNLDELLPENGFHVARALVGTESTCALTLSARLRLLPSPQHRATLVIGYPDPCAAGDQVAELRATYDPLGLEAFPYHVVENMERKGKPERGARLLPDGNVWLLLELGADSAQELEDRAHHALEQISRNNRPSSSVRLLVDKSDQKAVWQIREDSIGASRVPGVEDTWPGWEDAAVAPDRLGDYLRGFTRTLADYGYAYTLFGHFGDGCVHCRISFDTKTTEGVRRFRAFMEQAADLVVSYGGSLSGEHGDGQARGELLPKMYGPRLVEAFREFKRIWDPDGQMNPGKVVDPYPLDSNLRVGPDYTPRQVKTYFQFPEDHGSFAEATERCFGIGKCRGLNGGTMCPSFMVTREEQHTTRGRAHLLFELMRGDVLRDGWRDEHVKEALDLCLGCKGCKGDCPVSVDVASYKAEFLAHYYAGQLRPRSAYAFGLIMYWARLASLAPGLVNFFTQAPLFNTAVKAMIGVAAFRRLPRFAQPTFKQWFGTRGARNVGAPEVILWPDTFNNAFHPETAQAAVEVLETAGFRVTVPKAWLCCGRPLYDYGMLRQARTLLRRTMDALGPQIDAGVPIVGLEPSCVAVFRDELLNLFPRAERARKLASQTFTLSEFLTQRAAGVQFVQLDRAAVVQAHCHHRAIMRLDADEVVLSKLGLDYTILDSGCCGMAGAFGFEAGERYEVSIKAGERVLLPAVRSASNDILIVADGFSCREQIAHGTHRRALHLAEVIQMALNQNGVSS